MAMPTRVIKHSDGNGLGRAARAGGPGERHLLPQQTRDAIVEALHAEGLTVGARLPNEFVLADRLGVSRSTIREAMKLLEQEGVVEVRPGKGRFVSVTTELEPERPITQFESLTNMMRALGHEVSTVVLSVIQRKATETERAALGCPRVGEGHRDPAAPGVRREDRHLLGEHHRCLGARQGRGRDRLEWIGGRPAGPIAAR